MNDKPNVTIIGAGYVGLVSSACLAELGFNVVCIDKDPLKINNLKNGDPTLYEPSLVELIQYNQLNGRLKFCDSLAEAILDCNIIFIAVGTPIKDGSQADLTEVKNIIRELASLLQTYKVIVVKSTVPVGTCRELYHLIHQLNPKAPFDIVSNPEFLKASSSVKDFMMPDRIVIGTESNRAYLMIAQLYQSFIDKNIPVVHTTLENAELIKYASNAFLATKIAFVNEIAYLCEKVGANVTDVLQGMGLDKRIGMSHLQPGPGFGGSCLSKDALTLSHIGRIQNAPIRILETALNSNILHKNRIVEKIIAACSGSVTNKKLAMLGMAFKANTDDIRESPALYILSQLQTRGALLTVYDPIVKKIPLNINVRVGIDIYDTIEGADAVIIMTEWDEFRKLDLKRVKTSLRNTLMEPTLIDLRNLFSPLTVSEAKIQYYSIGRLTQSQTTQKVVEEAEKYENI